MTSATSNVQRALEALQRRDTAALGALYAPDALVMDPLYDQPLRGREAVEKDMQDLLRAFPDMSFSLRSLIVDGNLEAAEWTLRGTHSGPLAGPNGEIAATGRQVELRVATFTRYNARQEAAEESRYYDIAGWMQQLGIA
jgi:steroid delta-isomerase-like uncharacterized protein